MGDLADGQAGGSWAADGDAFVAALAVQNRIDYQKLGTSYFKGLIYTNGYVYASNEVTVIGALVADGDASLPAGNPDPDNPGLSVYPGDVYLTGGSHVIYNQEYFDDDIGGGGGSGTMGVSTWIGN